MHIYITDQVLLFFLSCSYNDNQCAKPKAVELFVNAYEPNKVFMTFSHYELTYIIALVYGEL